jgi:hypothetical protein
MNGGTLPAKHGFPLRCLLPGRYGQKQPKWIKRIVAQRQPHIGHWEGQGWSDAALILPNARIEQPADRSATGPDFVVSGVAFTDDSGLDRLEISLDDGRSWQEAELLRGPNPYTWTTWWLYVESASPGRYRVLARATDGGGHAQVRARRRVFNPDISSTWHGTFPDGTDEMHAISVQVRPSP